MALSIPKLGFSSMLKEGTKVKFLPQVDVVLNQKSPVSVFQHYRGVEESVIRNIEACNELVEAVRSAYGPCGKE